MLRVLAARLDEAIVATGRVSGSMRAAAVAPDVVVTVGPGGGREAELLTRFFTRATPGVGVAGETQGRLALEHVTQQHPSAGVSAADRAIAEIYLSLATLTRYTPPPARGFGG